MKLRLAQLMDAAADDPPPPPPLFPSNSVLVKVYKIESDEALDLCRQCGVPIPAAKQQERAA